MNHADSFDFAFRLVLHEFELATWSWAVVAFLISFFVIGLFWGLAWNRRWSFFGHWTMAVGSAVFAVLLGLVVLNYRGAGKATLWIDAQRSLLARELSRTGSLNREIFHSAWDKLQPLGGQTDLVAPGEGGNELRLNHDEDARVLAHSAADAVKRPLLSRGPFALGVMPHVRDAHIVADEVLQAIPPPVYPVLVSPDNEWSKQAVANQVNTALDAASRLIKQPMEKLKSALSILGVSLLLIQIILVALAACRDIKENPKV